MTMTPPPDGLRVPDATPEYGAASWLAKRASLHAGRDALVEGTRHYTYGELGARVTRLANALRDRFGLGRTDRVATLTANCTEFVELTGEEHQELAAKLTVQTANGTVAIGPVYEALIAAGSSEAVPVDAQARFNDPHLILYTAGTTGHPKGAVLTHANVIELGRVTLEGTGAELLADPHVREAYLA